MLNIVIDTETLDTKPTAVVLSMGIVPFNPTRENTLDELRQSSVYLQFDKQTQIDRGRTISQSTLDWWETQGEEARKVLAGGDALWENLHTYLQPIYDLVAQAEIERRRVKWWSRGNAFDIAIIDHICDQLDMDAPWRFWNVRDVRTACDGVPDLPEEPEGMVPHHSGDDAAYDAMRLQHVYKLRPWDIVDKRKTPQKVFD